MDWNIWIGDVLDWSARYDGPSFHAALLDPPYELSFMNSKWDGTGISFRPETWAALAAHLLPGGFLMAFGGTRGYHRMACAAEDAGLIIHPLIGWAYGSGFPKATRIRDNGVPLPEWQGHRYGLQALKPALEPIMVAQRPYEGRPVDSITTTGAGALNIEAGRIPWQGSVPEIGTPAWGGPNKKSTGAPYQEGKTVERKPPSTQGRWPPNLALSHAPACVPLTDGGWQCADDGSCAVQRMGARSGELSSGKMAGVYDNLGTQGIYGRGAPSYRETIGDSGTAARFFPNPDYLLDRLEASDPFLYTAKAPPWEREAGLEWVDASGGEQRVNIHPTIKPIKLAHWLASLLLPPDEYQPRRLLVPFSGTGSEMIGAGLAGWDWIQGIELSEEYAKLATARLAWWQRYYGWSIEVALEAARRGL